MIITISGLPGSGKSTVAKIVAEKLGFKHYSTGDIQRELAKERDMTITEWGEQEAKDKSFDLMIDNKTEEIAKSNDNLVMDSWLAPHFVPKAVKIFLECNEAERARRRLQHKRAEEQFDEIEQTIKDMKERVETNQERWIRYYEYDFLDMSNYDLIVDVANILPEQVVEKVLEFVEDFK